MTSGMLRRLRASDVPAGGRWGDRGGLPHRVRSLAEMGAPRLAAARRGLTQARDRLTDRAVLDGALSAVIVGGVLLAPVACVVAVLSVAAPAGTAIHRAGAQIFAVAAVWFLVALCCAHLQRRDPEGI